MNLRWQEFEKPLRARLKSYDARSKMTRWQRLVHHFSVDPKSKTGIDPAWVSLSRAFITVILITAALYHSGYLAAHPDAVIIGIGIWGLFATLIRADVIRNTARAIAEYRNLWMLPLTADQIYHHWRAHFYVGSICLFLESLCAYGILAFSQTRLVRSLLMAFPCATLQVAFSFALALLLVRKKGKTDSLSFLVFIYAYALICASQLLSDHRTTIVLLSLCNPMEWIGAFYFHGWIQGEPQAWLCLVLALAVLTTLPASFRILRQMHHDGSFRNVSASLPLTFRDEGPKASLSPPSPASLRQELLSKDILQPLPWNARGPRERLLFLLLSPNEIFVASGLLVSPRHWTKRPFELLVFLVLLWGLHTNANFDHLYELVARDPQGPFKALALMIADWAIFVLAAWSAIALFSWPAVLPSRRHLMPLRGFDLWKISAKVNAVIFALLLPLTLLIRYSPFGLPPEIPGGEGLGFLGRVLTVAVSVSFVGMWTFTVYSLDPLNRWQSMILRTLVIFILACLGLACGLSPSWKLDCVFAPLLLLGSLSWSFLCGKLEVMAWRLAASKTT